MTQSEQDYERVKAAAKALGEHFDSVNIVASRMDADSSGGFTDGVSAGVGNYYARYGMMKKWIIREEERSRVEVQKEDEE